MEPGPCVIECTVTFTLVEAFGITMSQFPVVVSHTGTTYDGRQLILSVSQFDDF
jgi:hypothetical protein